MFSSNLEHSTNMTKHCINSPAKPGLEMLFLLISPPKMLNLSGVDNWITLPQTCLSPLMEFGSTLTRPLTNFVMESATMTNMLSTQSNGTFHTFQLVEVWRLMQFNWMPLTLIRSQSLTCTPYTEQWRLWLLTNGSKTKRKDQ